MAHSLSAKKRIRQNAERRKINRSRKHQLKTQVKYFQQALGRGDAQDAEKQFKKVVKKLDEIAATSTMHKNTAARKKSKLAKRLNALKNKQA